MAFVLFRSADAELVERGPLLLFRRRPIGAFLLATFLAVVAGLVDLGGQLLPRLLHGETALATFAFGSVQILLILVALLFLSSAYLALASPYAVLDRENHSLRYRTRTLPLAELAGFALTPFSSSSTSLVAHTRSGETLALLTVFNRRRADLQALLPVLRQAAPAADTTASSALASGAFASRFAAVLMMAIGLLWLVGGYFFYSGLVFTSRHDPGTLQIPIWTTGLIPLGMGLLRLIATRRRS